MCSSVPIPQSADPSRQRENLDVVGFELTDAEIAAISTLESGRLWDADPETHEEFQRECSRASDPAE